MSSPLCFKQIFIDMYQHDLPISGASNAGVHMTFVNHTLAKNLKQQMKVMLLHLEHQDTGIMRYLKKKT